MPTLGGHADSGLHEETNKNTPSATKQKIEIHIKVPACRRNEKEDGGLQPEKET